MITILGHLTVPMIRLNINFKHDPWKFRAFDTFWKKKLDIIYPQYSGKQPRLNIMPLNSDFRILSKN